MKTEFILGDAAQDFEKAVLERIAYFIKDDPLNSVLVITPPQATSSAEQMILRGLNEKSGVKGLMGVDISSINRTAIRILDETRGNIGKTLSSAGRSMAVKEILNGNKEKIKSLIGGNSSKDLPYMLTQTISELKSQNVTPEKLGDIETDNARIKAKLDDLALIYRDYIEKTEEYWDKEDRILKASQSVFQSDYIKNTDVIIYGFSAFAARTADFIAALMRSAKSTTVTFLNADKGAPDKGVYDICTRSRKMLEKTARTGEFVITELPDGEVPLKKAHEIVYTAKNLFSRKAAEETDTESGAIKIGRARDVKSEIDGVISQIVKLNSERGVPYGEIALVCGNSSEYLPIIKHRFKKNGVPCFTGDKRSLAACNIASFVITAFKLSRGRPTKSLIMEHAAAGFSDLNDYQRYELENYAYKKIGGAFGFFKTFDGGVEKARTALIGPIEGLRKEAAKAETVSQWIECVENYLRKLDFHNKIQRKINKMEKIGSLKEADYHKQAYKRIFEVLNEAKEICGNSPPDRDFIGVLEAGFEAEEIAVIPQTGDEVVCGDIYSLYIPDVSALFVLGINMGVIPDYKNETGILNETERELVFNSNGELKPASRTESRKLSILKAFARPAKYLYLSYIDNSDSKPSLLMDRVKKMNPAGEADLAEIAPAVKNNAMEFAARRLRNVADGLPVEEWGDKYEQAVYKDEELAEYVAGLKNIKNTADYNLRLDRNLSSELYSDNTLSATRTQTFYTCPYKYFIQYGLNVNKMPEAEVSRLDRGNFAHNMLDRITKEINAANKSWDEIDDSEFDRILEESKKKTLEETAEYNYSDANAVVLDGLSEAVKDAARSVRKFASAGELKPYRSEVNFKEESLSENLSGKIDRIDTAEIDGQKYFGIVDYKSSDTKFDINKFFGGINIQLIFYLMAVEQLLGEEYLPAGAAYMEVKFDWNDKNDKMSGTIFAEGDAAKKLYGKGNNAGLFSVSAGYKNANFYAPEDAAKFIRYLKSLIKSANERISEGDIGITPAVCGSEKCLYCDYRSICFKDGDDKTGDRVIPKADKDEVTERISKELDKENEMD